MGVVFATFSTWVTPTVAITRGEAWDSNDPVVQSHPDWFTSTPPDVRSSSSAVYDASSARQAKPVEQATAAPGEQRTVTPRVDQAFDEATSLREKLTAAGVKVDGRWSLDRLRQEAAKVTGE